MRRQGERRGCVFFHWFVFLSVLFLFALSGTGAAWAQGKDMVTWTQEFRGKTLSFEKGEKLPGMKPGEENLYIEWRWNTTGRTHPPQDWQPPEVAWEEIEELTKGHLRVKKFYNGALGSVQEGPMLVGTGLYESHQMSMGNYPDFMLADLGGVPFAAIEDQELNAKWATAYNDLPVAAKMWEKKNLFPLLVWTAGGLYLWTKDKEFKTAADLKGVMCATKGIQAVWVEKTGMVPVNINISAVVESLQKGLIGAAITWPEIAWISKWYESFKYCLMNDSGGIVSIAGVNMKSWKALPEYMQNIILKYRIERYPQLCKEAFATRNLPSIQGSFGDRMVKEHKVKFYTLPPEDAAKYQQASEPCFPKWLEGVEKGGISKTEAADFLKQAIAERDKISGKPFWYKP